jgi:L-rhamnonate dehydratase
MKITNIKIREIQGTLRYPGAFFEERRGQPTDIYPEFKAETAGTVSGAIPAGKDRYKVVRNFVQIDTDEGVSGLAGPYSGKAVSLYIETQLKPLLIGRDPLSTEFLWDIMYRSAVMGRKGDHMTAISHIDIALWDIKGKWFGQPVYKLLGGPMQDTIPAYASTSGYSLEPEKVADRVKKLKRQGYLGTKWFIRLGPTDGVEGIKKNVAIVEAARGAGGADMEIMIDAWNSWDVPYTLKIAELIKDYRISWIEEPVMPDFVEGYAKLRALSPIPIAGGEHEFTRYGAKMLLDMEAVDILQLDPTYAGGISEIVKVYNIASTYDVKVIIHGSLVPVNAHLSFAQNKALVPMMEYLVVRNEATQLFFKNPVKPVKGFFTPPEAPGVGLDLDEKKIESEREISFTK